MPLTEPSCQCLATALSLFNDYQFLYNPNVVNTLTRLRKYGCNDFKPRCHKMINNQRTYKVRQENYLIWNGHTGATVTGIPRTAGWHWSNDRFVMSTWLKRMFFYQNSKKQTWRIIIFSRMAPRPTRRERRWIYYSNKTLPWTPLLFAIFSGTLAWFSPI